jgi:hypothetical protein
MSSSTLTPDNLPAGRDRRINQGHGTAALGPSDNSDSGSDLVGAPGLAQQAGHFGLEAGNTSEDEESFANYTAGPDIGDSNLDSDTDAGGTGERGAAARDKVARDGSDVDTDQVERIIPDLDDED